MRTIKKAAWLAIKDRKVLFARSKGKTTFYCLGGKIEEGETPEHALIREVLEEVKVKLDQNTIAFAADFKGIAHGQPEETILEIKGFFAEGDREPEASAEITELAWFTSQDHQKTTPTGRLIIQWLQQTGHID